MECQNNRVSLYHSILIVHFQWTYLVEGKPLQLQLQSCSIGSRIFCLKQHKSLSRYQLNWMASAHPFFSILLATMKTEDRGEEKREQGHFCLFSLSCWLIDLSDGVENDGLAEEVEAENEGRKESSLLIWKWSFMRVETNLHDLHHGAKKVRRSCLPNAVVIFPDLSSYPATSTHKPAACLSRKRGCWNYCIW